MQKTSTLTVVVGIFVLGAILLFIGFSLRIGDESSLANSYKIITYVDDAGGVEIGSDVQISGINSGRVTALRFDASQAKARMELSINQDIQLPEDSTATVEKSAFFGNSVVTIQFGDSSTMVADGGELEAVTKPDLDQLIASVTETSEEARSMMSSLDENQKKTFTKIEEIIEENREDIRSSTKSIADAGPKLDKLAANMEEITNNLKSGQGTLGKLYQDEQLYNDLKDFSSEAKQITSDIRNSEGTLAKLIYDDAIAVKAEETLTKISDASTDIQNVLAENRDKIDNLVSSMETVGPKIEEAANKFQEFGERLNSDEGTLGKLLNDPSLYKEAERTLKTVGENFEAAEEQGVIRSFFGVIFGSLV